MYNTGSVILIENGAEDHLVTAQNRERFFAEMDAADVDWSFHDHAKTPHGFALPLDWDRQANCMRLQTAALLKTC